MTLETLCGTVKGGEKLLKPNTVIIGGWGQEKLEPNTVKSEQILNEVQDQVGTRTVINQVLKKMEANIYKKKK